MTYKHNKGFTILEMVASSTLLSLAVVSLCSIGMRSMTGVSANREYERAWQILDRQLTLIDYIGIGDFIELGQTEGEIGGEGEEIPAHYWNVMIEESEHAGLYFVGIAVSWGPEKKRRSISTATMLYDQTVLELLEEEESEGEDNG